MKVNNQHSARFDDLADISLLGRHECNAICLGMMTGLLGLHGDVTRQTKGQAVIASAFDGYRSALWAVVREDLRIGYDQMFKRIHVSFPFMKTFIFYSISQFFVKVKFRKVIVNDILCLRRIPKRDIL